MKLTTSNSGLWPAALFPQSRPLSTTLEHAFGPLGGLFRASEGASVSRPALNAWESDEAYFVEFATPGIALDDIEVTVHDRTLKVSGERTPDLDPSQASYHRQERFEGSFERSVELPLPVDTASVTAKLENGLLLIELPKAEEALPRRITVRG